MLLGLSYSHLLSLGNYSHNRFKKVNCLENWKYQIINVNISLKNKVLKNFLGE